MVVVERVKRRLVRKGEKGMEVGDENGKYQGVKAGITPEKFRASGYNDGITSGEK
ncbi:hypothetical protein NO371_17150 [Escherichia coli]|nr:hypothetical protein [Escherichia coli]